MTIRSQGPGRLLLGLGALHAALTGCMEVPDNAQHGSKDARVLAQEQTATRRIDLRVLVVTDGGASTEAIIANLREAMVPHEVVKLSNLGRKPIDDAYLATTKDGVRHANFQAVVLPNEAGGQPGGDSSSPLKPAELAALERFRGEFQIRQLNAYVWPSPSNGFEPCEKLCNQQPKVGADGLKATLTAVATNGDFSYLNGAVPFEDNDRSMVESAAYFATALKVLPNNVKFTPLLEVDVPGAAEDTEPAKAPAPANAPAPAKATLMGLHTRANGLEDMVLTVAMNEGQLAQQLLFPGILRWLTRGVHLGTERSFVSMHVDDVFLPNDRWSAKPAGEAIAPRVVDSCADCKLDEKAAIKKQTIMRPKDVERLVKWQDDHGLKLELAYNGAGYETPKEMGANTPMERLQLDLGEALLREQKENPSSLRWLNHTYEHVYLGCDRNPRPKVSDAAVASDTAAADPDPWKKKCEYALSEPEFWVSAQTAENQVSENIRFAKDYLGSEKAINPNELVTGEHGGLRGGDGEPGMRTDTTDTRQDNPHLVQVLGDLDIKFIGGDTSRDTEQRELNQAGTLTVPRYPLEIYYDCGQIVEQVGQYIKTHPEYQIATFDIDNQEEVNKQFAVIVDQQATAMLMRALHNDPRPHYVHQSNIAEDGILYPVLDELLKKYNEYFKPAAPLKNPRMSEAGEELRKQATWAKRDKEVTAYVEGGKLYLSGPSDLSVPLTIPSDSEGITLSAWAGQHTGWLSSAAVPSTTPPVVSEKARATLPSSHPW